MRIYWIFLLLIIIGCKDKVELKKSRYSNDLAYFLMESQLSEQDYLELYLYKKELFFDRESVLLTDALIFLDNLSKPIIFSEKEKEDVILEIKNIKSIQEMITFDVLVKNKSTRDLTITNIQIAQYLGTILTGTSFYDQILEIKANSERRVTFNIEDTYLESKIDEKINLDFNYVINKYWKLSILNYEVLI